MAGDILDHVIVGPGEGETITKRKRREVVLLADRTELSITHSHYAQGQHGPDPHVHREHTDSFYVLDGELTFRFGAERERVVVPAGTFLAVPPNLIHSFDNEGIGEARFLNFHTPDGGFARFLRASRDGGDTGWDSFDPPPDGGLPAAEAILTGAGGGERFVTGNHAVYIRATLPDLCATLWELDGPFEGPHLHQHDDEVGSLYVLEGELEMTIEDSVCTVGPGTLVSIPCGVRHTFAHTWDGTARFLDVHAPDGGFADFLRRALS